MLPLSAPMTSPGIPAFDRAQTAFCTQTPTVSCSLRHGMTTETSISRSPALVSRRLGATSTEGATALMVRSDSFQRPIEPPRRLRETHDACRQNGTVTAQDTGPSPQARPVPARSQRLGQSSPLNCDLEWPLDGTRGPAKIVRVPTDKSPGIVTA